MVRSISHAKPATVKTSPEVGEKCPQGDAALCFALANSQQGHGEYDSRFKIRDKLVSYSSIYI